MSSAWARHVTKMVARRGAILPEDISVTPTGTPGQNCLLFFIGFSCFKGCCRLPPFLCAVPPPEERNRLWMVEAEISPEMIKRKKKKKKRKKEVRPLEEPVDHQACHQREFGRCAAPRLPKLPNHPALVANLRRQQRLDQEVLPGSCPDFPPSHPMSCEESFPDMQYKSNWNRCSRTLLSDHLNLNDPPEDLGLGPCCLSSASTWQPRGSSNRTTHVARMPPARRTCKGPVHSRTNLMEAELMDADSDF